MEGKRLLRRLVQDSAFSAGALYGGRKIGTIGRPIMASMSCRAWSISQKTCVADSRRRFGWVVVWFPMGKLAAMAFQTAGAASAAFE